jgi:hypothetical protein
MLRRYLFLRHDRDELERVSYFGDLRQECMEPAYVMHSSALVAL